MNTIGLLGTLCIATIALTSMATAMESSPYPRPQRPVIDCTDTVHTHACIECGAPTADGIFCCPEENTCTVVPKPPAATRPPTLRKGLGSSAYFRR